jgi:hypothetical protein
MVDITPPLGVQMWGYFDRLTGAQGILDPLYARVLVLEAADKRVALVTLDLGRTFGLEGIRAIRESARQTSGVDYVLIAASHTHAGPVLLDVYPQGQVPQWQTEQIHKIEQAIAQARQHMVDARLGTATGTVYIGYNRRRVNPDGTVTMLWNNPTRIPTSPIDPTVTVLRVDDNAGNAIAVLVNYACHPVVFGADNLDYSADFPAVTTRVVEQALGGSVQAFFLQGAPGDINPFRATTPLKEDAIKARDEAGQRLGEEAARVAKSIHTQPDSNASLQWIEDVITFKLRWDPEKFRQALMKGVSPRAFELFAPPIQPTYDLPVTTMLINHRIPIMTMPGEPFVDFQINWRDRSPFPDALFLGYANGYKGYFPTIHAASEGGYGTASATTWVEVGAGERMVDHAVVNLYKLMGRLTDTPEDLR